MKRVVIRERSVIPPFGEPARELRILNKPLWLLQRDILSRHCRGALELDALDELPETTEELLVYRDNLFFNEALIEEFLRLAKASGHACQIAFSPEDAAITNHALSLQEGIRAVTRRDERGIERVQHYTADLFYYPRGTTEEPQPIVVDTKPREMGYYQIPSYMARHGDLVFQVPMRPFLSIENWVHVFIANSPFGVFSWGRTHEELVEKSWKEKLAVSLTSIADRLRPFGDAWRNHFLASSRLVKVGKNCSIDPSATIHGPTIIGNNVTIGAGVTITNSLIGDNVTIQQGSQVMLSVVSDRCFLPWNASLFMTTLMDYSMVAQLSCLQMCVVGKHTFIGAGNIFTDFHLLNQPLRTFHQRRGETEPKLEAIGLPVIGSAIGHNVKIGSGFVFYPARMIGSNTVLIYNDSETVIRHNVNISTEEQPEDDDHEPKRRVYLWPHEYDELTKQRIDPTHDQFDPFPMPSNSIRTRY
jgi:acetyltransferase-like isoleucine patch superfamily enzyme